MKVILSINYSMIWKVWKVGNHEKSFFPYRYEWKWRWSIWESSPLYEYVNSIITMFWLPLFALIASLIAIAVEWRYIYTIIMRRTIPNFTGWFIIALSMSFVFFSSLSAWAGSAIWLIGTLTILHTIEAILSLFYGSFRITRFEKWLIILAFLSLGIWYLSHHQYSHR